MQFIGLFILLLFFAKNTIAGEVNGQDPTVNLVYYDLNLFHTEEPEDAPHILDYLEPTSETSETMLDNAAHGVVHIHVPLVQNGHDVNAVGTGFFIRTLREENKVCFVTAAHVLHAISINDNHNIDIQVNHTDQEADTGYISLFRHFVKTGGTTKTHYDSIGYIELATQFHMGNDPQKADISLLLMDKDTMDLQPIYEFGHLYLTEENKFQVSKATALHHTFQWPMQISRNNRFVPYFQQDHFFEVTLDDYAIGKVSSGAPLINHADMITAAAFGVVSNANPPSTIEFPDEDPFTYSTTYYGYQANFTSLAALEDPIRQYCLQDKDPEEDYLARKTLCHRIIGSKL